MDYYLVMTAYGTEVLWVGSTGEQACSNAEAALGIRVVAWRPVAPDHQPKAA